MNEMYSIRLGYTCNNNCVMCYFSDKLGTHDMSTEDAKGMISRAKERGIHKLLLTGGEPTIRSDFFHILSYAVKLQIPEIEVQTNGRMFYYEGFVKRVAQIEKNDVILRFLIPIYGPSERIHDSITRSMYSFRQTVQGIGNLLKYNQTLTGKTVIMKPNYKYLPETVKLLEDLGVASLNISSMCISDDLDGNKKNLLPRFREVMPYLFKTLRLSVGMNLKLSLISFPLCVIRGYENLVGGEIPYKTILGVDPDKKIIELNVPEGERQDFTSKTKMEKCKKCLFFSKCGGVWNGYIKIYGEGEFLPIKN